MAKQFKNMFMKSYLTFLVLLLTISGVTQPQLITIEPVNASVCSGEPSASFSLTVLNTVPATNYYWSAKYGETGTWAAVPAFFTPDSSFQNQVISYTLNTLETIPNLGLWWFRCVVFLQFGGSDTSEIVQIMVTELPVVEAGDDDTVCENQTFTCNGSVNGSYESIKWSASGDGSFSVDTITSPVYTPGPGDIQSGGAWLILKAQPPEPCTNSVQDSLWLTIQALPTVDAGADVIICEQQSFQCMGFASACQTIVWATSGSGQFSNNSILSPVYTPSFNDILSGSVTLTLIGNPVSPCTTVVTDGLILSFQRTPQTDAGFDAVICENEPFQCEATANYYSSLYWISAGTGSFNNPTTLNPVYNPSDADIANGSVYLKLFAYPVSPPCPIPALDSLKLTFQKLPAVSVGQNITICEDQQYLCEATGENYAGILWTTSGSGAFDNPQVISALYTPGNDDIINGSVVITATASAVSPCVASASDSFILSFQQLPDVSLNFDLPICPGDTVRAFPLFSGGVWSTVKWVTDGLGFLSQEDNGNFVYLSSLQDAGNPVKFTVTLTPGGICSTPIIHNFFLQVYPKPDYLIFGNDSVCANKKAEPYYIYNYLIPIKWSVTYGTIISDSSANTIFVDWVNQPGVTGIINVEYMDTTGCTSIASKTISLSGNAAINPPEIIGKPKTNPVVLICSLSDPVDNLTFRWFNDFGALEGEDKQFYYPGGEPIDDTLTYYVEVETPQGCITKSMSYSLAPQKNSSLNENEPFLIYPNPAKEEFSVIVNRSYTDPGIREFNVKILDMQGRTLFNKALSTENNTINGLKLANGIYWVVCQYDQVISSQRLIIVH